MINKGQHISPETEFKKGHKIWLGKKHSEESKRKMRKPKSEEYKINLSKILKGHKKSKTINYHKTKSVPSVFKGKERPELQGKNHWNWRGGITPLNRILKANSKWKIWRELVFLRDNFTCQNPNCEYCNNKIGVLLHPHHIKTLALYPELAFRVDNGITYCAEFHLKSGLHQNLVKETVCKFKEVN